MDDNSTREINVEKFGGVMSFKTLFLEERIFLY